MIAGVVTAGEGEHEVHAGVDAYVDIDVDIDVDVDVDIVEGEERKTAPGLSLSGAPLVDVLEPTP